MVSLLEFTLTQQGDSWALDAKVICYNAYWLEHAPQLDLGLTVGPDEWLWRDVLPTVGGGRLSATVTGQPEKRRNNGEVQICDTSYNSVGAVRR